MFDSARSYLRMQVFAVPLDYCKAPERRPFKQKAAGEDPRRSCCHCYRSAYLQAGAPSEVAIPAGSAPSFTKMEHVTEEPPTRLLFVIVASQPPPGTLSVTRLLPVVGHQLTWHATAVQATPPALLVTVVVYLSESVENAYSAVSKLRKADCIVSKYAFQV